METISISMEQEAPRRCPRGDSVDTVGSLGVPETEGWGSTLINYFGRKVPAEVFGFHNVSLSPCESNDMTGVSCHEN